jgi:hypothetical protein
MWVPITGVLAALDLIRPNRTINPIQDGTTPAMLPHPEFPLAFVQMSKPLGQVITVLDGQSHQKRLQSGFFGPDDLPPIQVRFHRLRAPSNGAEGAKQMLHAEARSMQPHRINGEVMAKQEVITTGTQTLMKRFLTFNVVADKLRYIERTFLCFTVSINPPRERLDSISPELLCQGLGAFLLVRWTSHSPPRKV